LAGQQKKHWLAVGATFMAWYAYCITERQAFQNGTHLNGINGQQVFGYPSGDFAVIVSEYDRGGSLDQRALIDHARVVSECFRNTTVLPFRFGTVFDNDEALRRAVRANRRAFLATISRQQQNQRLIEQLLLAIRDKVTTHQAVRILRILTGAGLQNAMQFAVVPRNPRSHRGAPSDG
jgi:Gas vesicle synthesis protein GvpL/GvpF